jgi:archaellum component FlaC
MAEEQITEYQNDLGLIEKELNKLVQQRTEKINEVKEIDTRIGQLQGAAAYVRGKLNPQQVDEPEIEQVTIEENEDNTEGE